MSAPARTHPVIPSLQIWTDETKDGSEVELPPTSERYQTVEKSIHLAFKLLETTAGRASLVKTAEFIIAECDKSKKHSHLFGDKPLSELPKYVNLFLTRMRSNFPVVRLRRLEAEALALRFGGIDDMMQFNPKVAGDMYINRDITNALDYCRKAQSGQNHVTSFKFQLCISLAHEIVHFLYAFLVGKKAATVHTPKGVVLDGFAQGTLGESGRLWEGLHLGGVVEMWSVAAEPLGKMQSGEAYVFEHGRPSAKGWPVSMAYISQFVQGQAALPIPRAGTPKTRSDLGTKDKRTEMTRIRYRKRAKNDTGIATTSPPRTGKP